MLVRDFILPLIIVNPSAIRSNISINSSELKAPNTRAVWKKKYNGTVADLALTFNMAYYFLLSFSIFFFNINKIMKQFVFTVSSVLFGAWGGSVFMLFANNIKFQQPFISLNFLVSFFLQKIYQIHSKYLFFCVYAFEKFKIFKNQFEFWLKLKIERHLKIDIVTCTCALCASLLVSIRWISTVSNTP